MGATNILTGNSRSIVSLEALLDLNSKLNEIDNEVKILNAALLSMMGKLKFARGIAYIKRSEQFHLVINKSPIILPEILPLNYFDAQSSDYIFKNFVLFQVQFKCEVLAILGIGSPLLGNELSLEEKHYAELISHITANALQSTYNLRRLKEEKILAEKRNQMLSTIFEISRDFSSLLTRDQIIKMLSYHLMGQLMISRFAVLYHIGNTNFEIIVNRFSDSTNKQKISLSSAKNITNVLDRESIEEEYLQHFPSAELVVPMIVQGETKGLLIIGKSISGMHFDEMKKLFISAIANTAITALENERLIQEEVKKKALENELVYALEIQRNLMPKEVPQLQQYYVFGKSIPSRMVGGDYFDYFLVPQDRLLVAIADVSGKGLPAALLMANFQSALRILSKLDIELKDLVKELNNLVYSNTSPDKFITFFIGILDLRTNIIKYVNAGHNPPMYFNAAKQEILYLRKGGLLLGCLDNIDNYEVGEIEFHRRDTLLLYTDGVNEAQNEKGEEFGEHRIELLLSDFYRYDAELLVEKLISEVYSHSFKSSITDDITVVALKRKDE